jgi:putative membrane protein
MAVRARDHVPELAASLSLLALGAVFAAALGLVPEALLPHAPATVVGAIPHANAAVSALAILAIAGGVRAVRRGRIARHRGLMLAATALFATFLALYLYRIALEGPATFPGPDAVYRFGYLPLLAVHVSLAVVSVPLVVYVLLLALTHDIVELPATPHPRIGRVAAALWLVSFLLGEVVYLLLYVVY